MTAAQQQAPRSRQKPDEQEDAGLDDSQIDSNASEMDNEEEVSKLARIALIVEIMEETHKNKDWLVDQIKQKRQKIATTPAMNTVGILKMCSFDLISNLLSSLQSKERYDIDVTIPPVTR